MKKLFRADAKNLIYVMAEDQQEAKEIARKSIICEDVCSFHIDVEEILPSYPYIDDSWKDVIPYSNNYLCSYKTCSEIIKEIIETDKLIKNREELDKKQLKFEFYEDIKK
jgi:hypothetical protein